MTIDEFLEGLNKDTRYFNDGNFIKLNANKFEFSIKNALSKKISEKQQEAKTIFEFIKWLNDNLKLNFKNEKDLTYKISSDLSLDINQLNTSIKFYFFFKMTSQIDPACIYKIDDWKSESKITITFTPENFSNAKRLSGVLAQNMHAAFHCSFDEVRRELTISSEGLSYDLCQKFLNFVPENTYLQRTAFLLYPSDKPKLTHTVSLPFINKSFTK